MTNSLFALFDKSSSAKQKKPTFHKVIATISNGFNPDIGDNWKSPKQAEATIDLILPYNGRENAESREMARSIA